MTKKNRKPKDEQPAESFEDKIQNAFKRINIDTAGNESVEDKADLTEATPADSESAENTADLTETTSAEIEAEAAPSAPESESDHVTQPQESGASDEASTDDLLDDVRRSLIEDE